jgi:Tfp pilus assembly protein PilV
MCPASRLRDERGMTLVELMVAAFVLALGVLAIFSVVTSARELTSKAETLEAASHLAQQEIENMQSLTWTAMAHASTPASGPGTHTMTGTSYQHRSGQFETVAVNVGGTVSATATTWSDGRLGGQIWRFVSWVDDPIPRDPPTAQDYKRLTVVVTVTTGRHAIRTPVVVSTFAARKEGI